MDRASEFKSSETGGLVRLPVAAVEADGWQPGPPAYRVVLGAIRDINGTHGVVGNVRSTVIQFADGTIDDGSTVEPPSIHVYIEQGYALTAAQTRDLAQLLDAAAVEVELMSSGDGRVSTP